MKCAECQSVAYCKKTFDKYWADKSRNGTGCKYPFAQPMPNRVSPPPPPVKHFTNKTFF